ncbi:hypothetical protein B296_00007830 [Ensete ventricosum]|uniref:Uncharacterized protein n=1 Tax=Ensete ventricosum TaxID=4639 RepID=A0A427AJI9_ENSVE|nr:hypothetical protein B296_00007830 [Ensete ventricosum]
MKGAIELQPDDGPRSSLGIGPGSDDAMEPRQEFARRFVEGIGKLAGNTLGDRWKKTIGLATRMFKATGLGGTQSVDQRVGQYQVARVEITRATAAENVGEKK